eukprot:m.458315 g.458315  ORF g.458315 m.458315 type:complete len:476 (+) comp56988_c0_seq1:310-1737(+)
MSEDGTRDLWATILDSAQSKARALPPATLLLIGGEGSGKSTLVSRLKGEKAAAGLQGAGIEYTSLDVRDDDSEEIVTRLGVYTYDGTGNANRILSNVINKDKLNELIVVLVVDMARPWLMMDSLLSSVNILQSYLDSLHADIELAETKRKVSFLCQSFGEKFTTAAEEEAAIAAANAAIPAENIGLPIIIVPTKCDASAYLEKQYDFRGEQFDFIQLALRKFALAHGAGIVYTGKDGKSTEILYRYLLHLCYKRSFAFEPKVADRDAVFVPIGWDNASRVNILADGMKFESDNRYEDIIPTPPPRTSAAQVEVAAEDEQEFLKKQLTLLGKSKGAGETAPASGNPALPAAPAAPAAAVDKPNPAAALLNSLPAKSTPTRPASIAGTASPATEKRSDAPAAAIPAGAAAAARLPARTPSAAAAAAPKVGQAPAGPQNQEVLANFFNSLLAKKGPASGPAAKPAATDARTEGDDAKK